MFDENDEKYLLRRLNRNEVVLFLGAGFSCSATNRLGDGLPLSGALAAAIWDFLDYEGEWDGTPLPDMHEAMLSEGVGHESIRSFLEDWLLAVDVPAIYDALHAPYWYRIYTTNVDNVLDTVYARAASEPRLQVAAFPRDEPRERDTSLQRIQAVFLHGKLPCSPDELTFSIRDYADRAGVVSPLYEQFIGDYAVRPTIFLGTELNEPLFWQHVAARDRRRTGISEQRPKSFLIAPTISRPKRAQLDAYNVVPVEGYAEDFLAWIQGVQNDLKPLEEVLRYTLPSVVAVFENRSVTVTERPSLEEFAQAFHPIPTELSTAGDRSFYLLGATPRWEDIYQDLDAPRELTSTLFDAVEQEVDSTDGDLKLLTILGAAGAGKSTILRRLGLDLSRAGRLVFLTNSEELPKATTVAEALDALKQRAILLFDNAEVALPKLPALVEELRQLETPPVLVLASRLNDYDRRGARLEAVVDPEHHEIPNLSRPEIEAILAVLEQNGLLGRLQGKTPQQRIWEFESRERAGKQLLVAMREATSGRGFDEIIEDEFESLPTRDAKLLYLSVALATDAGFRLTEQQVVRSSEAAPSETLHTLQRNLRGIVLRTGPREELLLLRHRTIAAYVLDQGVSRVLLAEAYARLLPVIAAEVTGRSYHSRTFGLYRDLVNHKTIYRRFEADISEARQIYESIAWSLRTESHFWLQWGLLELEFGNLELAENYLLQAESLYPSSDYIATSMGHLYLKQAVAADSEAIAYELRRRGSEILENQMETRDSPYPYHIYCAQRLAFANTWIDLREDKKREFEHLREVAGEGKRRHPRNRKLKGISKKIEDTYLRLAIR